MYSVVFMEIFLFVLPFYVIGKRHEINIHIFLRLIDLKITCCKNFFFCAELDDGFNNSSTQSCINETPDMHVSKAVNRIKEGQAFYAGKMYYCFVNQQRPYK